MEKAAEAKFGSRVAGVVARNLMGVGDSDGDTVLSKAEVLHLCFDTEEALEVLNADKDGMITEAEAKVSRILTIHQTKHPSQCLT